MEEQIEKRVAIRNEHDAWVSMFKSIAHHTNISEKELNKDKFKPMFEQIERWCFYDKVRAKVLDEDLTPKGVLWDGD